ncbi:hypothetical protein JTE90_022480 [Oedothorax gibbosus]|uniref:SKP1 component POZ domain-containing protein n=1 Tax=Oedothorax gibbosus TaxID=931172 RepID=A0AAV6V1I3_9ARAC|nr:hypothetical protein JTE90_022480 [Oedothorax gibbosus]
MGYHQKQARKYRKGNREFGLILNMHFVKFKSSDGIIFELDKNAIEMSATFCTMVDALGDKDDGVILLNKFNSTILRLVVDWMNHHVDDPFPDDERRIEGFRDDYYNSELYDYDLELLKDCSIHILFQLSLAANYLEVDGLMVFASMGIANILKAKNLLHLKPKIDSCIRRLHLKVTEDMSAESEEMIEYHKAVEEMQVLIDEIVEFQPRVNYQLHCNNRKLTKEEEEEEKEFAERVAEMQNDIDEVIELDPVNVQRLAASLSIDETNNTTFAFREQADTANGESYEWYGVDWQRRIQETQEKEWLHIVQVKEWQRKVEEMQEKERKFHQEMEEERQRRVHYEEWQCRVQDEELQRKVKKMQEVIQKFLQEKEVERQRRVQYEEWRRRVQYEEWQRRVQFAAWQRGVQDAIEWQRKVEEMRVEEQKILQEMDEEELHMLGLG